MPECLSGYFCGAASSLAPRELLRGRSERETAIGCWGMGVAGGTGRGV